MNVQKDTTDTIDAVVEMLRAAQIRAGEAGQTAEQGSPLVELTKAALNARVYQELANANVSPNASLNVHWVNAHVAGRNPGPLGGSYGPRIQLDRGDLIAVQPTAPPASPPRSAPSTT